MEKIYLTPPPLFGKALPFYGLQKVFTYVGAIESGGDDRADPVFPDITAGLTSESKVPEYFVDK